MGTVDRTKLERLMTREQKWFQSQHPKSLALFEQTRGSLYAGVPMLWMMRWAGGFPVFLEEAVGDVFKANRVLSVHLGILELRV